MSGVVDAARAWIGTPFRHGASRRGAGTDCLGLVRGVYRAVVGPEPVPVPYYGPDRSEAAGLERRLGACLQPAPPGAPDVPGEVLLFALRDEAAGRHLGIRSEAGPHGRFVHAYDGRGVVESSLSHPWLRRVVARFRFPTET